MGLSYLKENIPQDYLQALQSYWHHSREKCLSIIHKRLEEESIDESSPAFYRLWIEELGRRQEKDSLEELSRHLMTQGLENPEMADTFRALRGLIHLEKDEYKMACLIAESYRDEEEEDNPWVLEFLERLSYRTTPKEFLKDIETMDYFHYKTASMTKLILDHPKDSERILKTMCNKLFPDCPELLFHQIHCKLDEANLMWEFEALIDRALS